MHKSVQIDRLVKVLALPKEQRKSAMQTAFASVPATDLLDLLTDVLNASEGYTSACDEAVWLHLVGEGDYHPDAVDRLNLPSFEGALNGIWLSEYAPIKDFLCPTCAYRSGTLGNQSLTTQSDVAIALGNEQTFYCHKNVDKAGGDVSTCGKLNPCKGFVQHRIKLQQEIRDKLFNIS